MHRPSIVPLTSLLLAAVVAVFLVAPASAQDAPTCLSRQLKLAAKVCKSFAKCHAGVFKAGSGDPTACIDAAEARLTDKLAAVEAKGGCTVEDAATGTAGELLDEAAGETASALTPAGGKCASTKMGAFGKRCAAELKCNAASAASETAVDPECVQKAAGKFEGTFTKADGSGACTITGDSAAIAVLAQEAVSETVAYLSGLTTSTLPSTTTLPTTTTTGLPPTTTTSTLPPPECAVASDCPGIDTECRVRACMSGMCGFYDMPTGTVLATQTSGDCVQRECNGAGTVVSVANDADTPDDGNSCTTDTCVAGTPTYENLPIRTSCGGDWTCDGEGNCAPCTDPSLDCTDPLAPCYRWFCSFSCQVEPDPTQAGQFSHDFVEGDCLAYFCGPDGNPVEGPDPTDGESCAP